ncbi:agmatinase [Candidatus Woesearchaeota archaeon]|nr:agmatinase [Candidatus Woesearchaeota archaeon]
MSWMRLPEEYTKDAEFVILPISYEDNPTYGGGASKGPAEIIKASEHLEYYDEQFDVEPFVKGIEELEEVTTLEKVQETVKGVGNDKFLISLGGDHAVTIGIVKGLEEIHDDFSVLILDAHSDFRYSRGGMNNHACVARRIVGKHKVGVIGVRSQDVDEAKDAKANKDIKIIKAYEYDEKELEKVLGFLGDKVYLSIDVDVFDPAFIRNTGTPEPGGFSWDRVISILEKVFATKNVIGTDIVEFAPKENYRAEAFALAKLAYKIMALHTRKE